ncbi:hypothetical protein FSB73_09450 [Arachidicoccus ginsenosidivorans]|jgi:hypothetical protein|uniref:Uncharacterized protein n=1 Tax=Arachidicoccus ginsenosidivorans TaxID=496057 RepID=A0A5B8VMN4_9BACT|nr:hypothetical protein [Arachidicoccus ginsenosidivorans]QEC71856.1 hypothetical protein FSB73_09450 [Arachidicoccus ginsenosidivorans]
MDKICLIDLFLTSLYWHFLLMKKRGRKVYPWFATCSSLAIYIPIIATLIIRTIFGEVLFKDMPEYLFLLIFLFFGAVVFFVVKSYFFNSGKYLKVMEIFFNKYSDLKRRRIKNFIICILLISPYIPILILWLEDFNGF